MDIHEYQNAVKRTNGPTDNLKDAVVRNVFGVYGELGEVTNLLKKYFWHHHFLPAAIQEELGDALWYFTRLCNDLDLSLEDIMECNVEKLKIRYPDDFSTERSIHREEQDAL